MPHWAGLAGLLYLLGALAQKECHSFSPQQMFWKRSEGDSPSAPRRKLAFKDTNMWHDMTLCSNT